MVSTLTFKTKDTTQAETYLWTATGIESLKDGGRYEEYGSPSAGDTVAISITAVLQEKGLLQMMEDLGHMEKPADPADDLPDMFRSCVRRWQFIVLQQKQLDG